MTRRERIEARIQQTTDRRLLRLLNRESWREFFFPSEQLESNGEAIVGATACRPETTTHMSVVETSGRAGNDAAYAQGGRTSCALTAPPEAV